MSGLPLPDTVIALFGGALRIGYLSTVRPDGQPAVVPVGVVIHDGALKVSSPTRTRKVENLRRNSNVSLCIPDPDDMRRYVTVRGTAEVADDIDRAFVDWLARTHMGVDEYPHEPRRVARTVITMQPERFVSPKVQGA